MPRRPTGAAVVLLVVALISFIGARPAFADDCAAIGGALHIGSGECRVSTPVLGLGGSFAIDGTLRITGTGSISVLAGSALNLSIGGSFFMDAPTVAGGGAIRGDNLPGSGAPITIVAAGDIELSGGGTIAGQLGAIISSNTQPSATLGCPLGAKGGNIILGSSGGNVTLATGTRISSSGQCSAGAISIAGERNVTIDGLVEAAGSAVTARGGPVWLAAGCKMTINTSSRVTSTGRDPGADRVHIESGCDAEIFGFVESVGGSAPDMTNPNLCAGTARPGKPQYTTGCVEVWSAGKVTVDNRPPKNGRLVAEKPSGSTGICGTLPPTVAQPDPYCSTWVDIYALDDIAIFGRPTANLSDPFTVAARQLASSRNRGGQITVKSMNGLVQADGRALVANANSSQSYGGQIIVEAGGKTTYAPGTILSTPDTTSNVNLGTAAIEAFGANVAPAPADQYGGPSTNGVISIRSHSGQITGGTFSATPNAAPLAFDFPPTGAGGPLDVNATWWSGGHLDSRGSATAVALLLNICVPHAYIGPIIPQPATSTPRCDEKPTMPDYVASGMPLKPVFVTVTDVDVPFDGAPHPAPVAVRDFNNDVLSTGPGGSWLTVTYNGNTTAPSAVGTYSVVATYSGKHDGGNPDYDSGVGFGTVTIRDVTLPPPPTMTVTGGTFTYDAQPHPATATVLDGQGQPIGPVTFTYNGSTSVPVNVGVYSVIATFAGNATYGPRSETATITINPATPVVKIFKGAARCDLGTPCVVTFNNNPQPVTTVVDGVAGQNLGAATTVTYNGSTTPPQGTVGTFTVVATKAAGGNYAQATSTGTLILDPATPTVEIDHTTTTYDGSPKSTSGRVIGVGGQPLDGLVISYCAEGTPDVDCLGGMPTDRGTYKAVGRFPASGNYTAASGSRADGLGLTILGLAPDVMGLGGEFVYDGEAHPVTGITVTGQPGDPVPTGDVIVTYNGLPDVPVNVGVYEVEIFYQGDEIYGASTGSATIVITPATPTVAVQSATYSYDGQPHPAVVTVTGVLGEDLGGPHTLEYNGTGDEPVAVGVYEVFASFDGDDNYGPAEGTGTITIGALQPIVSVTGGEFVFDGQPHPATGTALGVNGEDLGPLTFTYNGSATEPVNVGTYHVVGTFAGNLGLGYGGGTATATITIRPNLPTAEACLLVDFRGISYFNGGTLLSSSETGGTIDPSQWPYSTLGGPGTTSSRPALFRIYGFKADQLGAPIQDFDNATTYPVQLDSDIPGGAYYVDLGGPARVVVCVPQIQTNLLLSSTQVRPWTLPGTTLTDAQKNVPGIMLNHNMAALPVPERVRNELASAAVNTPLVNSQNQPVTEGLIHYVGVQLWGHGTAGLKKFVDVDVTFLGDSQTDLAQHYRVGFHTVTDPNNVAPGCGYLDSDPLARGLRMNDVWEGTFAGDLDWGASCTGRENASNVKLRADAALAFNEVQLLRTVDTSDETVRLFFGPIVGRDNNPPALNAIETRTVVFGTPVTFSVSATDPDGDPVTYAATGLPAGASFDPETRTFTWTPTEAQVGTHTITFTATDPAGLSDTKTATIVVKHPNRPPVLTVPGAQQVDIGTTASFTVSATDPDEDTLTYTATGLPAGATFVAATRTFTWPNAAPVGSVTVTFTATDPGSLSDTKTVTITVIQPNRPPVLDSPGNQTINAFSTLTFDLAASDPDDDPLTYTVSGLPAGATLEGTSFVWTPTAAQAGTHTVTFTVSDGRGGTASQTITITVIVDNLPPDLVNPGDRTVTPGTTIAFTLEATDPNPGDVLTYDVEGATGGMGLGVSTGAFAWTPTPEQRGSYLLTFRATDRAGLSDAETITINVINRPPTLASPGDRTTVVGTALTFALGGADADGDTLTYSAVGLPANATLDPQTGVVSWTPLTGQQGAYPVTFTVDDGEGGTASQTITLSVTNRPPVLVDPADRSVFVGSVLTFPLSATDPDGDTLTYSATNLPAGATIDPLTGQFRWVPSALQQGPFTVTFTATDPGGLSSTQTMAIDVPVVACVLVDFREVTYFRSNTVIMSSDAGIRSQNGIAGGFDPAVWPYSPGGGSGTTRARPTLLRIYGFAADQVGTLIQDVDDAAQAYPVVEDAEIPGAYYIDLGGKPARVSVCVPQLQTHRMGETSLEPWTLPGNKLTNDQRNVAGIMLNHNVSRLDVPRRVRDELAALGMPLVDYLGRPVDEALIDYVGFQHWGHGSSAYRSFVDVQIEFLQDSATDRRRHYEFGFHTTKDKNFEGNVSCNYLDYAPGNDTLRYNDVWSGRNATNPHWGPACGSREPSKNQKLREQYDVPFNAVQLLTTVNTADDTVRIFFGALRPEANTAPVLIQPTDKIVNVGSTLSFTLSVQDREKDGLTFSATGLPAGATISSSGRVTFRPVTGQQGVYTVTYTVTDPGGLADSKTATITVPDRAPKFDSISNKSTTPDVALTFTIRAIDPDGDVVTYGSPSLPAGATLNALTGAFAWTPTAAQRGSHTVTFTATDPFGMSDTKTITISVANRPPVLAAIPTTTVSVGTTLTLALAGSDPDGDTVTYSASGLPSGATLNAATGVFTWTPTSSQIRTWTVTFTVRDPAGLSARRTATIIVTAANRPPTLVDPPDRTVEAGAPVSFTLSASDPDNDTLTYSATGLPSGATLNAATGAFAWTPTAAQLGTHTITFTVRDPAGLTASQSMVITVTLANRPPTLDDPGDRNVTAGTPVTFTLSASDPDGDALTFSATGLPAGATLNAATGAFAWTPTAAQLGTHAITFKATDPAGLYATQSVTITVGTAGAYTTFSQGGWGSPPSGNNPGSILAAKFGVVYPTGKVIVGGTRTITLTSASAVDKFLPQGGAPSALKQSYVNPTGNVSVLAGQLLAAKLSRDFSGPVFKAGLGGLVVTAGAFAGQTVNQVIATGDHVLGGGALPSGVSMGQLNDTLTKINENFVEGTTDKGFLQ